MKNIFISCLCIWLREFTGLTPEKSKPSQYQKIYSPWAKCHHFLINVPFLSGSSHANQDLSPVCIFYILGDCLGATNGWPHQSSSLLKSDKSSEILSLVADIPAGMIQINPSKIIFAWPWPLRHCCLDILFIGYLSLYSSMVWLF